MCLLENNGGWELSDDYVPIRGELGVIDFKGLIFVCEGFRALEGVCLNFGWISEFGSVCVYLKDNFGNALLLPSDCKLVK